MDSPLLSPERLATLLRTGLLDSESEESFDRLTRLASKFLNAPVALVSLVDADRQFFKSCVGLPQPWASRRETPLSHSFCRHIVESGEPLVIEDARPHPLVATNLAIGDLGVIAYLGAPIRVGGHVLGALCVIDGKPRTWADQDVETLVELAEVVSSEIRLRADRAEVEASRRDLHVTLASLGEAVISVDAAGRVSLINRVAETLCGVTAGEAIGRPLGEIFRVEGGPPHFLDTDPAEMELGGLAPGGFQHSILVSSDGTRRPIEQGGSPIQSEMGEVSGLVLVFRDISRRMEEEELRLGLARRVESQARLFDAILSNTPDFVYVFGLDHRFTYANQALAQMFGKGEVIGKSFKELGYPEWHATMHEREIDTVVATRAPIRGIVPFSGTHGRRIYDYIFVPVLGPDDQVVAVTGTTRDITDRQRDEAMLAGQKHTLELLARGADLTEVLETLCRLAEEQSGSGMIASILVLDRDGLNLCHGAAASLPDVYKKALDGITVQSPIGTSFASALPSEPIHLSDIANDPNWAEFAELALLHGLRSCWSQPILSSNGEVLGTLAMYHDHPRVPGPEDLKLAEVTTQTAAIAIARARAEADLREARLRLESALSAGSVSTWTYDILTNRVVADGRLAKVFGVSAEDAAGGRLEAYIKAVHPDDREHVLLDIKAAIETGGSFESEYRIPQPDGPPRWVIARGTTHRDASGRVVSLPVAIVDVTSQKEAESALRESRAWLSTVSDTLPALVSFVDTEFRYRFINRAYEEWVGIPAEEISGRHIGEVFGNAAFESRRDAMEQALAGMMSKHEGEIRHQRLGTRQLDSTYTPYIIAGEVRGFFVMAQDATDRVRFEQDRERALFKERRTSEQLRNLAEIAARIHVASDIDSVLRVIAEEGRSLIGAEYAITSLEADERATSVTHRADRPATTEKREEAQGSPDRGSANPTSDDESPPDGWLSAPIVGRGGRSLGQIRLAQKLDGEFGDDDEAILLQLARMGAIAIENASLYQELRDKDRRKDEFLAMLAHELRNPLASIGNAVSLAIRSGEPVDRAFADEVIARQVKTFSRLIDDLLDVSRVSRGKIQIRPEYVDLAPILAHAVETVRPLIEDRKHTLEVSISTDRLTVHGDPTRLEQVVVNLLTNAAKYTKSGGRISLDASLEGSEIVVSVRDNGVGISAEMLPKVFDLFTQVDRSLDRAEGGLGIGLTLVRALAEMHRGSISVVSDGLEKGSEFTFRLPATQAPAATRANDEGPAKFNGGSARVLVVDDNVDSARSLGRLLSLLDYKVKLAHDGPSAVDIAEVFMPEFVLLDIGLPGLDGYEVARRIRLQDGCKDSTFIAVSGYGQQDDRRKSKLAGFDHHLVKPVDYDALLALISA
ncbi:PAS domain-containing protein [Isosphaeraceae bacterium EP7]